MKTISVTELHERMNQNRSSDLLDVRTPAEFDEVHAPQAKNCPLDSLIPASFMKARNGQADEPVFVICHTGSRARKACQQFNMAGFEEVYHVEGGTEAWVAAGLPVVRGRKAVSLERQVRIAAGSLVLLGVLLGLSIHPNWIWLSGFVGAGLVFAGITDTCGMGMLLAKMPWNRRRKSV